MFRMSMGSKSQKENKSYLSGVSRIMSPMSPINAAECGTPTTPPCDVERTTGSETYKGSKNGVQGTFTKTSFQTDFEIPGKPGSGTPDTPGKSGTMIIPIPKGPKKPFKNPQVPGQTYDQFIEAPFGSPGKTAEKYRPKAKTYGNSQRSDLQFVPDKTPPPSTPPPSTPPPSTPPPKKEKQLPSFSEKGKGSKRGKIGRIPVGSISVSLKGKGGGCPSGKKCRGAVNKPK